MKIILALNYDMQFISKDCQLCYCRTKFIYTLLNYVLTLLNYVLCEQELIWQIQNSQVLF